MKIALGIEYDGTRYKGWQRQPDQISVQAEIEKALSTVADEAIKVICAGRTDAGVHASLQIVHFETEVIREDHAWVLGTNCRLPNDISIKWIHKVDEDFHARFSAVSRRYRYYICNTPERPAVLGQYVSWFFRPLDHQLMHKAAQCLVGKHDFSAFRDSNCQANSPVRTLEFIEVTRKNHLIMIDIQANAFLHHMVRNIVGALFEIGQQRKPVEWLSEVLATCDRKEASITAPASGLFMVDIVYPERYHLPQLPLFEL